MRCLLSTALICRALQVCTGSVLHIRLGKYFWASTAVMVMIGSSMTLVGSMSHGSLGCFVRGMTSALHDCLGWDDLLLVLGCT